MSMLVFGELFYLFNCRSLSKSMFSLGVFTNPWIFAGVSIMIILQGLFIYAPWMNKAFHSEPVSLGGLVRVFLLGLLLYVLVEVEKWMIRRAQKV